MTATKKTIRQNKMEVGACKLADWLEGDVNFQIELATRVHRATGMDIRKVDDSDYAVVASEMMVLLARVLRERHSK